MFDCAEKTRRLGKVIGLTFQAEPLQERKWGRAEEVDAARITVLTYTAN